MAPLTFNCVNLINLLVASIVVVGFLDAPVNSAEISPCSTCSLILFQSLKFNTFIYLLFYHLHIKK